jgi:hypothetical protein
MATEFYTCSLSSDPQFSHGLTAESPEDAATTFKEFVLDAKLPPGDIIVTQSLLANGAPRWRWRLSWDLQRLKEK